jgi:hypothetical protein
MRISILKFLYSIYVYIIKRIIDIMVAAARHIGTARKSSTGNISVRTLSVEHDPNIKLPPEENGERAADSAPITTQVNKRRGLRPVEIAIDGIIGNIAGQTTPSVLLKKAIIPPIIHNVIGTINTGKLPLMKFASILIVPASIATEINMPTPQIIIKVFHGTNEITFFSSASFSTSATTDSTIEIRPTSICEFIKVIVLFPGIDKCSIGATSTIEIMETIKYMFVFCFPLNGSGLAMPLNLYILFFLLKNNIKPEITSIGIIIVTTNMKVVYANDFSENPTASIKLLNIIPLALVIKFAPASAP